MVESVCQDYLPCCYNCRLVYSAGGGIFACNKTSTISSTRVWVWVKPTNICKEYINKNLPRIRS
jgi:hypothetical protein